MSIRVGLRHFSRPGKVKVVVWTLILTEEWGYEDAVWGPIILSEDWGYVEPPDMTWITTEAWSS